jgi:hypothetical protein
VCKHVVWDRARVLAWRLWRDLRTNLGGVPKTQETTEARPTENVESRP